MPELLLCFPGPGTVNVSYAGTDAGPQPFTSPVTEKDHADIAWYIETYGARSLADPDDTEAKRIKARLPEIGKALFEAVFSPMSAMRRYLAFCNDLRASRVVTIDTQIAAILSLPWELLHDPTGVFLFRENPRIGVRRRISGATGGRAPFLLRPKETLHLLFVVSRPSDAGFLDPRADPGAVLDALEAHAPGRVTWEVLRPATLDALEERLRDETKPAVDILHFDGHGVFTQVSEEDAKQDLSRFGKGILSEIQRERLARGAPETKAPVGIGFLLFERRDGTARLISAEDLKDSLFGARVALVVLSACQTAALDAEGDPMASVAGRLTATGIPAILAMTHSVLAVTTKALFGRFYASVAKGKGIAVALDDARAWLDSNPEKFEVQRGKERRMLKLDDWFLPALFHGGADAPLLTRDIPAPGQVPGPSQSRHNLRPAHESGFFGRRRELWQIECWLSAETRRITLTGFGGQGKTELALEAARWLLRTGPYRRAVFVDYAQVASSDALAVAVSTIGNVLGETLSDAEKAGRALAAVPTLVILDNLETVPPAGLASLLDAAAAWSGQKETRILLTTRRPDLAHPEYRIQGTRIHRRIALEGLGSAAYPDDALDWYVALTSLPLADDAEELPPPSRHELIALFDRVAFHPLSIAVLAQQLRTRSAKQLGERLTALLDDDAVSGIAQEGTPASLIASLRLSLDHLSPQQRQAVGRLAVFQGGAFEDGLLTITGLGDSQGDAGAARAELQALLEAVERDDPAALALMGASLPDGAELFDTLPPDLLEQIRNSPDVQAEIHILRNNLAVLPGPRAPGTDADPWPALRRQLESAGLIEAVRVPGVPSPFIRFHPNLAPLLWAELDPAERDALTLAHRQAYCVLAGHLYDNDMKYPHETRAIALRELPNLLHAVDQALAAQDPGAVDFVNSVNLFLGLFGRTQEVASLTRRAESVAGGMRGWPSHFEGHRGRPAAGRRGPGTPRHPGHGRRRPGGGGPPLPGGPDALPAAG